MLRRYSKGIAIILLMTFGQELILPSAVWALTGGPSQPEVNSFEPVGTNQMVDLSTGDFNYNIPLMVVPGPNGGYPINLAYHAGIGMEQEASWVGLGWNINPGAITRNLRGVPDDFSGDEIVERVNYKKDITVGLRLTSDQLAGNAKEVFGLDVNQFSSKLNLNIYHNNYRGVGYDLSLSPISLLKATSKLHSKVLSFGFSLNSETGLGVNPVIGLGDNNQQRKRRNKKNGYSINVGINSKQGLNSIRFVQNNQSSKYGGAHFGGSQATGISFATSSPINNGSFSMSGYNHSYALTLSKPEFFGVFKKNSKIDVNWITNSLTSNEYASPAYGTLHLEDHNNVDNVVSDVYVHNDIPVSKRSVNMGMPTMNSDVFMITGQGIGGAFRAHRNDLGRFYERTTTGTNVSNTTGLEGGVSTIAGPITLTNVHVGVDQSINFGGSQSYSGNWTSGDYLIKDLKFTKRNSTNPNYEPSYFKISGEQTASDITEWDRNSGEDPIAFNLGWKFTDDGVPLPKVKNSLFQNPMEKISNRDQSKERIKRMQNIEYSSKADIRLDEFFDDLPLHFYNEGAYPDLDPGLPINYVNIDGREEITDADHHIHEYSILKPDGSRYSYGLPAYNISQKSVVFTNVTPVTADEYDDLDLIEYDAINDADITNDEGIDHYYSSNEIPSYVHSHMITQITSADYVDLTGNGVSADDFGFYAKFNYTEIGGYKWRDPFYNADYVKGNYSNVNDDKATYNFGEKKLYYTHSIETKTHVAIFEIGDRADGVGVSSEHQTPGTELSLGQKQKYLKKIHLYSKNDPNYGTEDAVPLQSVHFEYDYSLCPNVLNNDATAEHDPEHIDTSLPNTGKLTLKKVFITYNGNEKGRLSPYSFNYTNNKQYSRLNLDRWGNYQESIGINDHAINPYTRQDLDEIERNSNASAWCLSQIELPSGGTIGIEYESDDYGYVQDKRAAQMVEIAGFSEVGITSFPAGSDRLKLKKKNLRLWFKADALFDVSDPDERALIVQDYVKDLDEIYFKVFEQLKLKHDNSALANDYVVGYAKVNNLAENYYGAELGTSSEYAYIDLEKVDYKSAGLNLFETHPFKKAGWQYLRYSRPDLFTRDSDYDDFSEFSHEHVGTFLSKIGGGLTEALSVIALGQYGKYNILRYCNKMSTMKTSFIRLNSPNKLKFGGGHRVKEIKLTDNWTEGSRDFGTEYEYQNEDGFTSGVADYEPIVGGEENALKKPIWFDGNDQLLNFQSQDLYLETPISEALYPGARIVYGRVIVRNLENELANESQSSIKVNEFYTSKDFPIKEDYTKLSRKGYNVPLFIPWAGMLTYNNNGYSQGYSVVLNDMSGKPKSVAEYPYRNGLVEGEPVSSITYKYRVNENGELDNRVKVLDGHGVQRMALIGVDQDVTIHQEEHSNQTDAWSVETNVDLMFAQIGISPPALAALIPSAYPNGYNHSEAMYRGISTSKVIYKSGILDEVIVFSDGSTVSTKNLIYDAETGEALLTSVNNEWDKPIFNYNYAAHWNYDGMGGAYKNYRAKIYFEGSAGSFMLYAGEGGDPIPAANVLISGDEITINEGGTYRTYYVSSISGDSFDLQNKIGGSYPETEGVNGVITRSGRRNLQAIKSGSIVALNQSFLYADSDLSPQFALWNEHVTGNDPQAGIIDPSFYDFNTMSDQTYIWHANTHFIPNYYECEDEIYSNIQVQTIDPDVIQFSKGCKGTLTFDDAVPTPEDDGWIFAVSVDNGVGGTVSSLTEQYVHFEIISESKDGFGNTESVEFKHLPSGNIYTAFWHPGTQGHDCWINCGVADILHSDAVVYSDDWGDSYPYADLDDPIDGEGIPIADAAHNAYRYGKKGIWRAKKTYLYQISRTQTGAEPNGTRANVDGEYEPWEPYSWLDGSLNPKWDWVSEITMYSPYGYGLEEKSRLTNGTDDIGIDETAIYSSQLYGYNNSVVIATAALSSYYEFGYTGFEQKLASENLNNTGHINLSSTGTYTVSEAKSHTGTNSLLVQDAEEITFTSQLIDHETSSLKGIPNKDYVVSVWVNTEESGAVGEFTLMDEGISKTVSTATSREVIDGWKKLEIEFKMPLSGSIVIKYTSTGETYIDDLRIGPYDGGMVTYVYDRNNLWLVAELDGLNYATFYNYDSEGNLIQVKKETESGIVTVQTALSNTQH